MQKENDSSAAFRNCQSCSLWSDVVQYIDGDTKNDTIGVKWLDLQMDLDIEMCDKKYTARSASIYQEYSPFVIDEIITHIWVNLKTLSTS